MTSEKKPKFLFYMNSCRIAANSLQEAILKAEYLYSDWYYKYCIKVDKIN